MSGEAVDRIAEPFEVGDGLKATSDAQARDEAAALWTELVTEHAFSYYAQLAGNRLYELSPETMASLERPSVDRADAPWQVRQEYLESRAVQNGLALAKLGLLSEALAELNAIPRGELMASEYAFVTELRWQAGDWLQAHSEMHRYLNHQPPEVLGDQRDRILLLAYPEMYWSEVQTAASTYRYDPRVFHALPGTVEHFERNGRHRIGPGIEHRRLDAGRDAGDTTWTERQGLGGTQHRPRRAHE